MYLHTFGSFRNRKMLLCLFLSCMLVLISAIPFYLGNDGNHKVLLDSVYLIKNKFTVNLKSLHNLIPEAHLYDSERIFKNAISCQYSCHERTKFTQCSCDLLCEQSGDCCYDYWHFCKTNETQSANSGSSSSNMYAETLLQQKEQAHESLLFNETQLTKKVDEIEKTKSLYASCGVMTLPNNEDVSIKLISLCAADALDEEVKNAFFSFTSNSLLNEEVKHLTYDMTHLSKYGKYKTVYEKLCVSNDLYVENYEQARKLLYIAYDLNTNLFYKNYFCARCNNITSRNIKVIDPKIKCPLEFDLELKNLKKDEADFHVFKYESPCVFTYKMPRIHHDDDENEEEKKGDESRNFINYRKCISDNNLLKIAADEEANKASFFLSLFIDATNSTLNGTAANDEPATRVTTTDDERIVKFYSNLCNLFLLPVNVNITRKVHPVVIHDANFRNMYCIKSWLLQHRVNLDRLNETQFIQHSNQTWLYENDDYRLEITRYNIFKPVKQMVSETVNLNQFSDINEDFRNLHQAYKQLSLVLNGDYKKLDDAQDAFVLTTPKRLNYLLHRPVQSLNLTKTHSDDPIIQLIQYERRRSALTSSNSPPHNFTIKITLLFSTKLNQMSEDYDKYRAINLNDLTDDEKLFLFKQIISDMYVNKLIERYDLRGLLLLNDFYINLAYLPSDSRNDYRFNVDIHLLIKLDDTNLNNLNERLKAVMQLITKFFHRDFAFFKLYKETAVRRVELLNYFVSRGSGESTIDDKFYCIHDSNDIEFYSSDEFQVNFNEFMRNHLVASVHARTNSSVQSEFLFLLTRLHLFGFNESNYFSEAKYHRYSVVFDKNLFKYQNKLHIRYCNLKKIHDTVFISNVALSTLDCPAAKNELYLVRNVDDSFRVSVHSTYVSVLDMKKNITVELGNLNIRLFKSGSVLPSLMNNKSVIIGEHANLLVCIEKSNNDDATELLRLNHQQNAKFHFWLDENDYDVIDEIIENFMEQFNDWGNILWTIFTGLVIFLLSYIHIKF